MASSYETRIVKLHRSLLRYGRAFLIAGLTLADTGTSAAFKLKKFSEQPNTPIDLPDGIQYLFVSAQMACALFVNVRNTVEKMLDLDLADRSIEEVYRLLHELQSLESDLAEAQCLALEGISLENFLINRIQLREGQYRHYAGKDNLNFRDLDAVFQLRRKFLRKNVPALNSDDFDTLIRFHTGQYQKPLSRQQKRTNSDVLLPKLDSYLKKDLAGVSFFNLQAARDASPYSDSNIEDIFLMSQCLMNIKLKLRAWLLKKGLPRTKNLVQFILESNAFKKSILEEETKRYLIQTQKTENVFLFHEHIRQILQDEAHAIQQNDTHNLKAFFKLRTSNDKRYLDRLRRLARDSATITRDYYDAAEPAQYSPNNLIESQRLKAHYQKAFRDVKDLLRASFLITRERDAFAREEAEQFQAKDRAEALLKLRHQNRPSDKSLAGSGEKVMNVVGTSLALVNMTVFCMMTFFGAFALFSAPPFSLGLGAIALGIIFGGDQAVIAIKWAMPKIRAVFKEIGQHFDDQYAHYREQNGPKMSALKALGHIALSALKKLKSPLSLGIVIFVAVKQPLFYYAVQKTLLTMTIAASIASPIAGVLVALTAVATLVFFHRQILKKGIHFSFRDIKNKFKTAYEEGRLPSFLFGVVVGAAMVCMTAFTKAAGDYFGFGHSISPSLIACAVVGSISFLGNALFNFGDTVNGITDSARWLWRKMKKGAKSVFKPQPKVARPNLFAAQSIAPGSRPNYDVCKQMEGLIIEKPSNDIPSFLNRRAYQAVFSSAAEPRQAQQHPTARSVFT